MQFQNYFEEKDKNDIYKREGSMGKPFECNEPEVNESVQALTDCSKCGTKGEVIEKSRKIVADYKIPFYCSECGSLYFPYKPLRDIVFLWADSDIDKIGSFYVPPAFKERHQSNFGTILEFGRGYYTKDGKFVKTDLHVGQRVSFDKETPWGNSFEGSDGNTYWVRRMGAQDVQAEII